MPINAAIFDMDGLLINSERIALNIFLDLCVQHELEDMTSLYMACLGTNGVETRRLVIEALTGRTDPEKFLSEFNAEYRAATFTEAVPLMEGVEFLLDALDKRNINVAVATSTKTDLALHKLENSKVLHRFEFVIGGDQVENGKPSPEIYLRAAAKLGVNPADCMALEDSPNGVRAAAAAKMQVIQIPDIVQPTNELLDLGHTVLQRLNDVVPWLDDAQSR